MNITLSLKCTTAFTPRGWNNTAVVAVAVPLAPPGDMDTHEEMLVRVRFSFVFPSVKTS